MFVSTRARWRPAPFLVFSGALHLAALAAAVLAPGWWPLWLGAVLANQALITLCGLLPRCGLLGANLRRLPPEAAARGEVALTFDDGPDAAVTPRLLDLLDAASVRATFFCVGERVAAQPTLAREIVRRGHLIENHTQTHPNLFATFGPRRMAAQIDAAQAAIAAATGRAPRYFRAVAGLRNPFLEPLLARRGLRLASWTRRPYDTRTGDAATVLRRLTRGLAAGDVLLLHDGHAARTPTGEPVLLAVLPALLDELRRRGLRAVTLEAACAPRPAPVPQGLPA